jgi:site-specific DNA-methyltransferase (adenine-specific)
MILDNTMGVGTTCLGAKELNRKFIGIEKEVKYYDIACRRVFEYCRQTRVSSWRDFQH